MSRAGRLTLARAWPTSLPVSRHRSIRPSDYPRRRDEDNGGLRVLLPVRRLRQAANLLDVISDGISDFQKQKLFIHAGFRRLFKPHLFDYESSRNPFCFWPIPLLSLPIDGKPTCHEISHAQATRRQSSHPWQPFNAGFIRPIWSNLRYTLQVPGYPAGALRMRRKSLIYKVFSPRRRKYPIPVFRHCFFHHNIFTMAFLATRSFTCGHSVS